VPAALAARLMRVGFVKADGKGVLDRGFYVSASQVAAVSGDVVRLSVSRDELIREG